MTRWPVKSSTVEWIAYEPALRQLFVQFKSGLYRYDAVPSNIPIEILAADSVGKYLHARVRAKFPYTKLDRFPVSALDVVVADSLKVLDAHCRA